MDDSHRLQADGLDAEPALRGAAPSVEPEPPTLPPTTPDPDAIEHTVWDEPALLANASAAEAPEGELTYARWLEAGIASTPWSTSLLVTLGLALAAGPFGILGAFASASIGTEVSLGGLLAICVLAPVTEEITKVAGVLWVVEKRPYWFKSMAQVLLCAAAGGLAFAAIENVLYLYLYHPEGGEAFREWRWTICTALHVNCSLLVGWGLVRIWDKAIRTRQRPELSLGTPLFALAMLSHGAYNLSVTLAEVFGWLEFE